jgi:hypothetical protein
MSGHKSTVNALNVYRDSSPDVFDDPKVETIAERELAVSCPTALKKKRAEADMGAIDGLQSSTVNEVERSVSSRLLSWPMLPLLPSSLTPVT